MSININIDNDIDMTKDIDLDIEILTRTTNKLEEMNHIKNINTQYNNLYASLTKFGKVMAKNLDNENLENFKLYKYDKNLFFQVNKFIK
jgi:DNA-binding MarR family transcriptional regulator